MSAPLSSINPSKHLKAAVSCQELCELYKQAHETSVKMQLAFTFKHLKDVAAVLDNPGALVELKELEREVYAKSPHDVFKFFERICSGNVGSFSDPSAPDKKWKENRSATKLIISILNQTLSDSHTWRENNVQQSSPTPSPAL